MFGSHIDIVSRDYIYMAELYHPWENLGRSTKGSLHDDHGARHGRHGMWGYAFLVDIKA